MAAERSRIDVDHRQLLNDFTFSREAPPLLPSISAPTLENHVFRVTGRRRLSRSLFDGAFGAGRIAGFWPVFAGGV